MASSEFDDALWLLLCDLSLRELEQLPPPVRHYFASRYLQWDVGNGGFAQAAYNIPEFFGPAADGYEALGYRDAARLIRDAMKYLPKERAELERKNLLSATIDKVFDHFNESRMAAFDAKIREMPWEIDAERVAYVRKHRDVFRSLGQTG